MPTEAYQPNLRKQMGCAHPGGAALTRLAFERAGLRPGSVLVDLGCGNGSSSRLLSSLGLNVVGIDPAIQPGLRDGVMYIASSAEDLPLPDAFADAVLAECSLSLMNLDLVFTQCTRVLKPGGIFIISDLYARNPPEASEDARLQCAETLSLFVFKGLQQKLEAAGFHVEHWEDRSRDLACYTAEHLMNSCTGTSLWGCSSPIEEESSLLASLRSLRPGYFLLFAGIKKESVHERYNLQ